MIDRVLVLLLAGCALFGGVIVVELTSEDAGAAAGAPAARRPEPPAPSRAQGPRVDDLLVTILGRPLFSPTRQPAARESADRPADLGLTDVRLTGIVIEPGHHLAIFAVPGAKPMVRSEGERVNDWRVDSITLGEVVLSGPTGSTTLQPKIDPHLVRPTPAPPRPAQIQPQAARSPAAAPAPPGAAPPRPIPRPAVTPAGTPLPSAARGRE